MSESIGKVREDAVNFLVHHETCDLSGEPRAVTIEVAVAYVVQAYSLPVAIGEPFDPTDWLKELRKNYGHWPKRDDRVETDWYEYFPLPNESIGEVILQLGRVLVARAVAELIRCQPCWLDIDRARRSLPEARAQLTV